MNTFQMVLPNIKGESGCRLVWDADGEEKIIYLRDDELSKLKGILKDNSEGKIDLECEGCFISVTSDKTNVSIPDEVPLDVVTKVLRDKIVEFVAKNRSQ